MDIGKMIKFHRINQELSMNELSKRSSLAQSGLSEIESGKRQPTFDSLEKIITLGLNMTLSDFFSDTDKKYSYEIIS